MALKYWTSPCLEGQPICIRGIKDSIMYALKIYNNFVEVAGHSEEMCECFVYACVHTCECWEVVKRQHL